LYPEYTGTLGLVILKDPALRTPQQIRARLDTRGLTISEPLGFTNTYALEPGPAVRALHEAGAEGRGEPWMPGEVAQRLEPEPVGHLGPHGQRVGVGEAERLADRQPPGVEPCADLLWRPERGVLQDDEAECSRVLRIEVDRPRLDG